MKTLAEQTKLLRETGISTVGKKILIYSRAKTGKTALAGTILKVPSITRVFWFDLEKGLETIPNMKDAEGQPLYSPEELDKVQAINLADTKDDPRAIVTLLEAFAAPKPVTICQDHGHINCPSCADHIEFNLRSLTESDAVVLDSGSQLGNSALNWVKRQYTYKDKRLYYVEATQDLNNLFSMIQACNTNVIMPTHELELMDDAGNITTIVPLVLSRGFSVNVGKYFGHVINMCIEQSQFKSGSSPTYKPKVLAGSRANIDFSEYSNPSLELLYKYIAPDKAKFKVGGKLKVKI